MEPEKLTESVAAVVRNFIGSELAYGDEGNLDEDVDLIKLGVIESMSLLRLVTFLEKRYQIEIQDEDVVADNFRSLRAIEAFMKRSLGASQQQTG